ncbi:MAG: ATP-grasp domain-containing protein, partial [Sphingomonas sp.]
MTMLPPGSTIGILGGGQLGRMIAIAAAQLGYRTHVLAPDAESVAAQTASSFTRADYHSRIVLDELAANCDVVTYEFENIALEPVEYLAGKVPVHPAPPALGVAQDRASEKQFVNDLGGRTAPWRKVTTREELDAALAAIGTPAILKTLRLGYDGKGQVRLKSADEAEAAWEAIGGRPAILEGHVAFDHE